MEELISTVPADQLKEIIEETAAENALVVYRMTPSEELDEPEREVWDRVINSVAVGHITEKDRDQLVGYCRAVVHAQFCKEQIQKIQTRSDFDPLDKAHYTPAIKWAEALSKQEGLILSYARAMRITNSAFRTDEQRASNITSTGKELWEE